MSKCWKPGQCEALKRAVVAGRVDEAGAKFQLRHCYRLYACGETLPCESNRQETRSQRVGSAVEQKSQRR